MRHPFDSSSRLVDDVILAVFRAAHHRSKGHAGEERSSVGQVQVLAMDLAAQEAKLESRMTSRGSR